MSRKPLDPGRMW